MTAACPACAAAPLAMEIAARRRPNLVLSLPTIHCAACIGKIEHALASMSGVSSARVNLSLRRVSVTTDRPVEDITRQLTAEGYEAFPLNPDILQTGTNPTERDLLTRLGVAGFAMMNVMLLSVAIWSGASDATRDLFHLISAAIAVPVVAYSAQPFFRNAWSALGVRSLNMDVPISLAILLAATMSLYETLNGGQHAYFDAALSLTFFLLIGRYLDLRTRGVARSAAKELAALEVHTAERLQDGHTETVKISDLKINDDVLIPTGVRTPVDGILLTPDATTDRSFLTGETIPSDHKQNAPVQAGEINLGAPFRLRATAVGEDTTLRRVATLVENAENAKNRYTTLADKAARIYAPAVHLLALAAFLGWVSWDGDVRHALNVATAVLIITCPCALGLAVPAVSATAIGALYRMGILVKSGTALERLAEVDTVVFDKTGTLTLPGPALSTANLIPEHQAIVRALAQTSAHPFSRILSAELTGVTPVPLADVKEVAGRGVIAQWQGQLVQLGRGEWLGADFAGLGFRIGDICLQLSTTEHLRAGADLAVRQLAQLGMKMVLLSGDRVASVEASAKDLPFDQTFATVTAEEKHQILEQFANNGRTCAMVGDGLNDAASLAVAHVSIAPASALDAARSAADMVIIRESFENIPRLVCIAKSATHLARQNFAIAAAYNAIAIPVALMGFATPLIAALAMSFSSLSVMINAIRVRHTP